MKTPLGYCCPEFQALAHDYDSVHAPEPVFDYDPHCGKYHVRSCDSDRFALINISFCPYCGSRIGDQSN